MFEVYITRKITLTECVSAGRDSVVGILVPTVLVAIGTRLFFMMMVEIKHCYVYVATDHQEVQGRETAVKADMEPQQADTSLKSWNSKMED